MHIILYTYYAYRISLVYQAEVAKNECISSLNPSVRNPATPFISI